jgi:proteasome assembly chaperone (PAC2) family protein
MDGLIWDHHPRLRRPILVAAFEGWSDAADAASTAAKWLIANLDARRFARLDPETYFDFQSSRPQVELVDGVTRGIAWPSTDCFAASVPSGEHDLVIVVGVEPNLHWRGFCDAIRSVAAETGCELVVTLGALLADVPHTRPLHVTGAATDPEVIERLGLARSRYEGPTGIVGVLHDAFREAGVPSASLWAPVPHYVAAPPNPVAAVALLDRFVALSGIELDRSDLMIAAAAWREQVDEVVAGDDDVANYVRQLEEAIDAGALVGEEPSPIRETDLPTGDALAAELERFLRDESGDG